MAEVFEAQAASLYALYISQGNLAGFRIPVYQRTYDWGKENIQRLIEDSLSGLRELHSGSDSLTFIGTIILIKDLVKEQTFDGTSLSVVDGQQRLTTSSLICLYLHEQLRHELSILLALTNQPDVDSRLKRVSSWLHDEVRTASNRLLNCVFGNLLVDGIKPFPFPRIVREGDRRGTSGGESEYRSFVGRYLFEYAEHVRSEVETPFDLEPPTPVSGDIKRFLTNVSLIKNYIKMIGEGETVMRALGIDLGIDPLNANDFERAKLRKLFRRLPEDKGDQVLAYACKHFGDQTEKILRLLGFASYFLDCVVVTNVIVNTEKYAFDIFDALNTTGEPLTAIETFKPLVIQFEQTQRGYADSPSEKSIRDVEEYLNRFPNNADRQQEARDLIIPFALYLTGERVSRHLSNQRRFLRSNYIALGEAEIGQRRQFVQNLAHIADYKGRFWKSQNLAGELRDLETRDEVLMCLDFLSDLGNSLTIPVLCRYFVASQEANDWSLFSEAVRALTAFVAIRRSATGGTAGIDSDLRNLMLNGKPGHQSDSIPLCVGRQSDGVLPDLPTFRTYLKEWLKISRNVRITDKASWIEKAKTQGLYRSSSVPLCRFLLLCAAHNSRPDSNEPWRLKKERASPELNYLNYQRWRSSELETIEHIAPDNDPEQRWDRAIYAQPYLRHSLGNLTLLPKESNSAVGNTSWEKKRLFYQAFASERVEQVEEAIQVAHSQGISFGERTSEMLKRLSHLPIARTISAHNEWNAQIIEQRTMNLLDLIWEQLDSWLFRELNCTQ